MSDRRRMPTKGLTADQQKLAADHMYLVLHFMRKNRGFVRRVGRIEAESALMLGLVEAAKIYDPSKSRIARFEPLLKRVLANTMFNLADRHSRRERSYWADWHEDLWEPLTPCQTEVDPCDPLLVRVLNALDEHPATDLIRRKFGIGGEPYTSFGDLAQEAGCSEPAMAARIDTFLRQIGNAVRECYPDCPAVNRPRKKGKGAA